MQLLEGFSCGFSKGLNGQPPNLVTVTPPENERMPPWKGTVLKVNFIWTNHRFSGDMSVFRLVQCKTLLNKYKNGESTYCSKEENFKNLYTSHPTESFFFVIGFPQRRVVIVPTTMASSQHHHRCCTISPKKIGCTRCRYTVLISSHGRASSPKLVAGVFSNSSNWIISTQVKDWKSKSLSLLPPPTWYIKPTKQPTNQPTNQLFR